MRRAAWFAGGAFGLWTPVATPQGFDARLAGAVAELEPGLYALLVAVAYVLGLAGFGAGFMRMVRMSEERGRGPGGAGTALCFAAGTAMFSFPAWLASGGLSLFGADRVTTLSYAGEDAARYTALLQALFAIVNFVGVVAFLKGWWVLRNAADAVGRATMASGVWHIVGGLLAWHIQPVLAAVQETVGVELLRAG